MNKRFRFVFVVVGMFILSIFISFNNASAASSGTENKVDAYNIWRCYNSGQITRKVPDIYSFGGIDELFTNRQFLPEIGTGVESCLSLMTERLPSGVPTSVETPEQGKVLLTTLGYSPVAGKCYQIRLGYRTGSEINGDGNQILSDKICEKGDTFSVEKSNDKINIPGMNKVVYFDYDYQNNAITLNASAPSENNGNITEVSTTVYLNNSGGLQGAMSRLNSFLMDKQNNGVIDLGDAGIQYWSEGVKSDADEGYSYELKSTDAVGKDIASKLTGSAASAFSKTEKRNLYENYLTSPDYYYVIQDCESETSPGSEYVETVISGGGIAKRCFVTASRMSGTSVNGLNSGGAFDGAKKTWQEIARDLYEDWKDEIGNAVDKNNEDTSGVSAEEENACYDAGIDGISWIACPALTNLTYTANGFDGIIDGMLAINPEYYNANSDAHTVWEVMRNIANIAMIVILLIIIVSQISGYGIDNYGIKKMLPKLVIVAILMNFSFVLCELIIDASNIVGVGLRNLFGGIGQSIGNGVGKGIGEIVSVLLGIAGGAGAVAGTGIMAAIGAVGVISGPMIILMMIMALLGVIVSLLIFFASLGIRLMLVIVCVGVAPIAAVCYILPNTKKGFDTWWKAFKSCLVIYPICGAMLGISELIKGIAWSSAAGSDPSGVAMKLVALVAPYLPFFLLPSLLRGAIGAVGNLSGMLNNISDKIRGTARSGADAIKNTEALKDATSAVAMNRQNTAAMRIIERLRNKTNLSESEKRRLGRARATLIANQDKMRRDSLLSDDVAFDAANIGLEKKADAESLANYMTLVNDRTRNGENEDVLFSMYDKYLSSGDKFGALAVARIAGRRKDTASRFMSQKIATRNKQQADINKANLGIFNSVAKEIATGDNAKNYRASDGVGFEYASQVNSGLTSDGPDFAKWSSSSDNIKDAAQHHITSRNELMGMKGSALNDLERYVHEGTLKDTAEIKRIEDLAAQAIANRNEAGSDWDSTKAEQLAKLSGKYTYDKKTNTFREISRGNSSNFVAHGGGYH